MIRRAAVGALAGAACGALVALVLVLGPRILPGGRANPGFPSTVAGAVRGSPASVHVHGAHDASAHEGSEGLRLIAADDAGRDPPGAACERGAPIRGYRVAALAVDITLNRYLDHDPAGRMYALEEDVPRIRQEEARNAQARAGQGDPGVSIGEQGDAIQPLTLRVNRGECLRIHLRNALPAGESASVHVHGTGLRVAGSGAAIATNPEASVGPGGTVDYEWMVRRDEAEGTYYLHSHGDTRAQTSHGLFGALIVEPEGSGWLDPVTGGPLRSGWTAMIRDPRGSDFREVALYYHEIGSESYQLLDRAGQLIPLVDPLTNAYRPGSRAINYRSEPFMNRLKLQQESTGAFDESMSYSSYAFGDPATPIARSYLGDPVRQRVIHAGSEVFHVHHVHGGAIRWRRQSGVERSAFDRGLDKHPPLLPTASERIDSQSLGPSETFDVELECGSGGCQQSVGDYLMHCHVAHHYFAGMWDIWRVYNTKQDGSASTDSLPPLAELPDRQRRAQAAVTSDALVGRKVDWDGRAFTIGREDLAGWVERQLPPPGVPKGYDASVLDWRRESDRYVGEPEGGMGWPGYDPRTPGDRPALTFDPRTGKLAYPFLRPHLGKRPPFAPNHGPAPFLDPIASGTDPADPGANGPGSVCPEGTRRKHVMLDAITLPIPLNRRANIVDPAGEIYVLKQQEAAVRADDRLKTPLAIRVNAGEDCLDVTLVSELEDTVENRSFSKVNAHIHFVQFDVQASDGVVTGFNYEQSVRPFKLAGEGLRRAVAPGADRLPVMSTEPFQPGVLIGVGMDQAGSFEVRKVTSVEAGTLVVSEPLRFAHGAGEVVSTEFVRYRWYPDVQFGTAYFHDHVNALASWRHGLFGALIAEPPGSTYHDPVTGAEIESGPVADIHTGARVSADLTGSFRELVMFVQDDNPVTGVGRSSGSSLNLRVEPVGHNKDPPDLRFSSSGHGDPETPVLDAFVGDPVVVRLLVAGTNDVHTWHVDGHWFRVEPYSRTSAPANSVHIGISERYDLVIPKAGGPQQMAGDYLYYSGRASKLREGSWGILRVHPGPQTGPVQRLPGHGPPSGAAPPICPAGAPVKAFDVVAVDSPLPMLPNRKGKLYVLRTDKAAVLDGAKPAEPLVLHVNVGDCLRVALGNETSDGPVSFHPDMLAYDPGDSGGVAAGRDAPQAVGPGQTRTYTFFAHPEIGETVALIRDWGDVLTNPGLGLYAAVVVGPRDARFTDPVTGRDVSNGARWDVVVRPPKGPSYRDFTLFMQDEDAGIGTHRMPYTDRVQGVVGLNYRSEPLGARLTHLDDPGRVFDARVHGDPSTPLMAAFVGDPVAVHVLVPWSEQAQVFTIEGHRWPFEAGRVGTNLLSSVQVGGLEAGSLRLEGGAGGPDGLPGDYLYGDHREPFREAGIWGLFRVRCPGPAEGMLLPLPDRVPGAAGAPVPSACGREASRPGWPVLIVGVLVGLVGALVVGRHLRRRPKQAEPVSAPE
jgi:hypothetical protein